MGKVYPPPKKKANQILLNKAWDKIFYSARPLMILGCEGKSRLILQTRAAPRLQLSRRMASFGQITGFNAHFLDFFVEGIAVNTQKVRSFYFHIATPVQCLLK